MCAYIDICGKKNEYGIFVSESGRLEREEFETMIANFMKPKEEIELELKDAFRVFDRDGDGFIDREGNAR